MVEPKVQSLFCAHGDQQTEGIYFFEIYEHVIWWTMMRPMLILEVLLELKLKQGGIVVAFVHTEVPPNEKIYNAKPMSFQKAKKDAVRFAPQAF